MAAENRVLASLHNDKGTWVIRGRVFDPETETYRHRSKSTGLKVKDNTKRQAERVMREIIAQWEKDANSTPVYEDPTFAEYVENWLEYNEDRLRPNTIASYRGYAKTHILPALGKIKVRDLTLRHLQDFYRKLLRTVSPNSVRKYHVVVFGALKYAVRDGIIPVNFARDVEFPPAKRFEGSAYTAVQASQLLKAAEQEGEPMHAAIVLAVCYGLRRSEVLGLRWKDIDFDAGTISIQNTVTENGSLLIESEHTKTASSRRVLPLVPFTVPYLKSLKQLHQATFRRLDKVCCRPNGTNIRPDYLPRRLHQIQKKYDLPVCRFHDLRHTAATLLAQRVRPEQVKTFLGHSDISTTMNVYTHVMDTEKLETSRMMSEILENAGFCSEICSEKGIGTESAAE